MELAIQRRQVNKGKRFEWVLVDKDTDTVLPGQKKLTFNDDGIPTVTVDFIITDGYKPDGGLTGLYFDIHETADPKIEGPKNDL